MRPLTILYVVAGIAAAAAGGVIAWRVSKYGESVAGAAKEVLNEVNPVNPNNVAARTVNTIVQKVTGDDQATLGTKLWELFNPGQAARDNAIADPVTIRKPAPGSGQGAAPDIDMQDFGNHAPLEDLVGGVPVTPFWYGAP